MHIREEHDLLGVRSIPADAYWGVHTLRARENFCLSSLRTPQSIIRAIAQVKKAACRANRELGYLSAAQAEPVEQACDEIAEGGLADQFTLDALQGGAGTSTNMNCNEVIANRALELMGRSFGDYERLHPLEHVNLHQSTNDVYPTAVKIAAIYGVRALSDAAAQLQGALQKKEKAFASILTIGRTELQEATPITLGAQFSSFADAISRDRWRAYKCEERLRVVNIGGTAVGTGITAPRRYIFLVIEKLRELTGLGLTRGENMMDQTANADALVEVSGILSAHASNLIKIGNDLRMLHYLGDIILPAVQAGSSIMPGKVNPVILESVINAGLKANANHALVSATASMGTFQIVEFLPLCAFALLESLEILAAADRRLAGHIDGVSADADCCRRRAYANVSIITALVPHLGYERAQQLVRAYQSAPHDESFRDFLAGAVGERIVDDALRPENIMALGFRKTKP